MKKLDIKVSNDQLVILVKMFEGIMDRPLNREGKVIRSVLDNLVIKFSKKYADVRVNTDLFSKKKTNFPLEYYEAHTLEYFIRSVIDVYDESNYHKIVMSKLADELNQKLA